MKHFGDITKLSGYTLPTVDVITGGSPCQDLSVAGKRAGLAGERSGLFMEQMRIVKEMRERDRQSGRTAWNIRPRYMVWENVPGAFTSGKPKGSDFAAVLEEIIKICEPDANLCVCVPDKGWTKSGCYYSSDGRWSIAWRVHDAQFWGVPQRRKRIALVADFGGLSAPEILFERKGLSRDCEKSNDSWKDFARRTSESTRDTSAQVIDEFIPQSKCLNAWDVQSKHIQQRNGIAKTLDCSNADPTKNQGGIAIVQSYQEITGTLNPGAHPGSYNGQDAYNDMLIASVFENHSQDSRYKSLGDTSETVSAKYGTGGNNQPLVKETNSIVTRLTPLECERLQGFPDDWTNIGDWFDSKGSKHKGDADSPRYKALGNSIAIPFWQFLARRICAQYERPVTLGSLFDGIGGFPLAFSRCGAIPVWASEIEEFPIAVTKMHFPEAE